MHIPEGARPVTLDGAVEPVDLKIYDLTLADHPEHDPDHLVWLVRTWIEFGLHHSGHSPALIPIGSDWWETEVPMDQGGAMTWAQVSAVAKDIFDVRPQLAAVVEQVTPTLAALTLWPTAEQYAPGCARAVWVGGYLRAEQ